MCLRYTGADNFTDSGPDYFSNYITIRVSDGGTTCKPINGFTNTGANFRLTNIQPHNSSPDTRAVLIGPWLRSAHDPTQ